ncbi:MAG: hypothetical protein EAZ57_05295 [Cytophagales bacterium]|nr:MAG: hypothetical protein EAZ67_06285 [Cytophagales bacterium]TAF60965.1 MAG: hypothetical protein EAZ57_05295 [Cytophagales bacterium]
MFKNSSISYTFQQIKTMQLSRFYWLGLLSLFLGGWYLVFSYASPQPSQTPYLDLQTEKNIDAYFLSENPLSPLQSLAAVPQRTMALLQTKKDRYIRSQINTQNTDISDFEAAQKLGVCAVAWAYAVHYERSPEKEAYLVAAEQYAQQLNFASYTTNEPSLVASLKDSQNRKNLFSAAIDQLEMVAFQLKKEKREYLCADVLAGAWLELAYLQVGAYVSRPNEGMRQEIIAQQYVLDDLIFALEPYREQQHHGELLKTLENLLKLYRSIPPLPAGWESASSSKPKLNLQTDRQIKIIFDELVSYRVKWHF